MADDYFVLARTGQSEMRALRNLKKEDRVKFTTLLELTRGRKRASKHIKDGDEIYNFSAIQDFLHDYYVEGMMMFVDLTRDQDLSSPRIDALASSSDGYAEWISFVNGVKEKCPGICPVIQVSPEDGESWDSYGEKILEQFEALSSNFPALAYRVRKNIDDSFDADLELLSSRIRRYTDSGFKFYFILDYEYIRVNTAELHSLEAASIIQVVNEICPTADIVLAATSFPSSVTDIGNEDRGDFPIEEVKFFELVANRLSNIVKIHYGDYGSIHPIRNDAVARGWRPRIDYPYAGRKVFYFREKREAKTIEANGSKSVVYSDYISHYCSVARKIYTDQRFLNDQHSSDITSWGISEIANAAENRVGGSTPSYWISVRMCIHIEQQLLRLSA
ncbi:beta family protein [Rhodobacter capsulatus]|uniref:beta family protein n=1 Tax=Rhodobacter capsulatus TaxID=1061 RepID=UPI00402838C9